MNFTQFFISVTGADKNGNCLADVKNMILTPSQEAKYNLVSEADKKLGDANIAYMSRTMTQQNQQSVKGYERSLKYMREDMKVIADELMKFADKN